MLGSTLSNALLSDIAYSYTNLGPLSGNIPINYVTAQYWAVSTSNNISLQFSNWPDAGNAGVLIVQVTVTNPAYTLQIPSAVSINTAGIQGLDTTTNIMSFAAAGVYTFGFSTVDGGTTIAIAENNKQLQPFNATSTVWASVSGQPIDLSVTTTVFANGTNQATLADGVEGQVIVLLQSTATTVVVTVANYGWDTGTTVGHVELSNIGESATLMFTNGAWFPIGANGALFN